MNQLEPSHWSLRSIMNLRTDRLMGFSNQQFGHVTMKFGHLFEIERLILKNNVGVHICSQRLVLLDRGQCLKSLLLDSLAGQRMPNKIETAKLIHFQFKFAARCKQHQRPEVSHGQ